MRAAVAFVSLVLSTAPIWAGGAAVAGIAVVGLRRSVCFVFGALLTVAVSCSAQSLGPHQPEFSSFTPAAQTGMVDFFTGDFRYSVPLFDVPGPSGNFPLQLSYQSGISPDQDATWVGLGWTLNPGAIVRQVRGLPDDFDGEGDCSDLTNGDCVATTEDIAANWTFGLGLDGNLELFGLDGALGLGLSAGFKGYFNSYRGLGYTQTIGASGQSTTSGINSSVGLNLSLDSQEGLRAAASLSLANALDLNAGLDAVHGLSTLSVGVQSRHFLRASTDLLSFLGYSKPTYIPGPGRDMSGWNINISLKGGGEVQGVYLSLQGAGFYTVEHAANSNERFNPAVGYLHLEQALEKPLSVPDDRRDKLLLDFNRENDGPIYDDSPNLAVPVLTHDLFVASGPDLAGTFRAYRNDIPYLFDTKQTSELLGGAIGIDIGGGTIAKFGVSGTLNGTNTSIGGWDGGDSGALMNAVKGVAEPSVKDPRWEQTYFKMIGESTRSAPTTALPGGDDPVAVPVTADSPPDFFKAESKFTSNGSDRFDFGLDQNSGRAPRGTLIESFSNNQLDQQKASFPEFAISRRNLSAQMRQNHIGGFRVTLPDGRRLIYAIPVYNTVHEEHEFSAARKDFIDGTNCSLVKPPTPTPTPYPQGDSYGYKVNGTEQYHHIKKLSPYVTSYLLTAVLGPDYIDADGVSGPSDGDFGYWVRFDYEKAQDFAWRRPFYGAKFIRGHDNGPSVSGTQRRNDKAFVTFGKREAWYLKEIHTQTHYAKFIISARSDGHAAAGVTSNQASNLGAPSYRLDSIELYLKDRSVPVKKRKPLKTAHFLYDYSLMKGAPGTSTAQTGRLTLKKVWATFGTNTRGALSPDEFDYDEGNAASNPPYTWNSMDRWGTYRSRTQTASMSPTDCEEAGGAASDPTIRANASYTRQDSPTKDVDAAAWSLRRIVEPSGREIKIQYEADDYAYVQDRPATAMVQIAAVNNDPAGVAPLNEIDERSREGHTEDERKQFLRVYFNVPADATASSVRRDYLGSDQRIHFRIRIALKKDDPSKPFSGVWETVSGYANVKDVGVVTGSACQTLGWVQLEPFGEDPGFHPFSVAAWQYLRLMQPELINSSAIQGDPNKNAFDEAAKVLTMADYLEKIIEMARGVYSTWFDNGWGKQLDLDNSWIRLHVPHGIKIGGGARVHQITYSDRWESSTGVVEPDALTGHVYEYRMPDGITSSGVASYEPAEGGDENAVRDAKPFTQKVLLASDYRLFAESPAVEAYFPAATVGYSRVTERSLASEKARELARQGNVPTRTSTSGPTVREYYTAHDFPVRVTETSIVKKRNPEEGSVIPIPFLGMITLKSLVASQGYSVTVNDMHGKLRRVTDTEYGRAWPTPTPTPTPTATCSPASTPTSSPTPTPDARDFAIREMPVKSTEYRYRATGGEGGGPMKLTERRAYARCRCGPKFARSQLCSRRRSLCRRAAESHRVLGSWAQRQCGTPIWGCHNYPDHRAGSELRLFVV